MEEGGESVKEVFSSFAHVKHETKKDKHKFVGANRPGSEKTGKHQEILWFDVRELITGNTKGKVLCLIGFLDAQLTVVKMS